MRHVALLALLCAGGASASEWRVLDDEGIRDTLTGVTLQYERATQDFRASGRTLYNAGQDSWGYWRVENDQYCSQWPPNDLWACYAVEVRGAQVKFVGEGDDVSIGTIVP